MTLSNAMPPQNSGPVHRIQTYLAIRSFVSIPSSVTTITNDQQARKMLSAIANPARGFQYSCEYYEACGRFFAGTDPKTGMPKKTLIDQNDANIDLLLLVSSGDKLYTGEMLLAKARSC